MILTFALLQLLICYYAQRQIRQLIFFIKVFSNFETIIIDFEKRYLNLKLLYAQRQIRILKTL